MTADDLTARADREAAALIIEAEVIPGISLNPAGVTVQQLVALAYAKGVRDATAEITKIIGNAFSLGGGGDTA